LWTSRIFAGDIGDIVSFARAFFFFLFFFW